MAMNPMQRKANNYLIIGVLVTLLITGTIIALLCMQLIKIQREITAEHAAMKKVYVISSEIKSGDTVDATLLRTVSIPSAALPSDVMNVSDITENTVAKINLNAGTILTSSVVVEKGEETTNDIRKQEYNMINLPTQIQTGEYIDIRLRLPEGQDYIVVSKKRVELPVVNGVDSENTIWLNMSEAETLVMSNAIVESYIMQGGHLYATTYIEPGLQDDATPTYVPSGKVQQLIYSDPNIVQTAKSALISRYNANSTIRTDSIAASLNTYIDDAQSNVEQGVQEEINKSSQARKAYLESLGGEF